jgi:pimeloyl-ACP methyl ester carboxylesterase
MKNGYSDFFYSAQDGLKLHAQIYGRQGRDVLPVICLPGLTRNSRDFHELALFLANQNDGRIVISFDYRGRGKSEYDRDWKNYTVPTEAADILAGLAALGIEHGAFIGTSRGGLIIMALAALRPTLLKKVIFNDVGPVIEGDGLVHIRTYLTRAPKPGNWAEAAEILENVNSAIFPAIGKEDWERSARAIYRDENGKPVPDFDPKLVKILTSIDLNDPLPVLWPQFDGLRNVPLMTVRGENSKLLSSKTLTDMGKRHPGMKSVIVEGQGHAPFLETAGLPEAIEAFLG